MIDQRKGMGAIPRHPELYVNERQVMSLIILKKFGWKLICIRRHGPYSEQPATILVNPTKSDVGILNLDGILRITKDMKIRRVLHGERTLVDHATDAFLDKLTSNIQQRQAPIA